MVKQRMDLLELLRKRGMDGDVDFLREALRVLVDGIMDAEVSAQIGAEHGERSPERVTYRNGYRNRTWDTRVGTMELHIPKLREGSYFPSLLEPRRRSEKALLAVIQQAYVEGVSTRRVDDLIKALGCDGISSSQVSRICEQLDEVVDSFLGRPLDGGPYPYVWLDGLTQKVREGGRIVNVCVVVATGVNAEGQREVLGMDVGTSEDGAFWLAFLRSLTARGLSGVELVTSDAHQGLKNAIAAVFAGAGWQRCRTHFMANLLTRVPKRAQPGVATMVRTIVSSNIKMCKSSKLELTHPMVMASSADTLRRYIRQIAKGGTSERDLRDERNGPFDPGDCQGAGRFPEHGAPVSEIAGSHAAEAAAAARVEAGPAPGVHRPANGGRVGELSGAGSGDPRPGLSG